MFSLVPSASKLALIHLAQFFRRCYAEAKGIMEYLFPALLLTVFALIVCKGILKENLGRNTEMCIRDSFCRHLVGRREHC